MIRLLIVDDESATRNGLLRYMDWKGLGVDMIQTAESGQEALAMCEDFQPDLVLSDIRMRGMNGVEMCTILPYYLYQRIFRQGIFESRH